MNLLPDASKIVLGAVVPGAVSAGTRLDTAYIEFTNGLDTIEPPQTDDMQGYYQILASSADCDYIRCAVSVHQLVTLPNGSTGLKLFVIVDQEEGKNGKPFSAAAGSKVYGCSIAASTTPDHGDLFFCCHYFEPPQYIVKAADSNVGLILTLEI